MCENSLEIHQIKSKYFFFELIWIFTRITSWTYSISLIELLRNYRDCYISRDFLYKPGTNQFLIKMNSCHEYYWIDVNFICTSDVLFSISGVLQCDCFLYLLKACVIMRGIFYMNKNRVPKKLMKFVAMPIEIRHADFPLVNGCFYFVSFISTLAHFKQSMYWIQHFYAL